MDRYEVMTYLMPRSVEHKMQSSTPTAPNRGQQWGIQRGNGPNVGSGLHETIVAEVLRVRAALNFMTDTSVKKTRKRS